MKVYLDTVGCRLNQSEIETYARQFTAAGHQLVGSMQEADLMVLNTCTVTSAAASDSRQKVRQAEHAGIEQIVVTGCLSTLKPESLLSMPGVVRVIPNQDKDHLVATFLQIEESYLNQAAIARQAVPGTRQRTRAFIKVQDGCNNKCTFCITTLARGESHSRLEEDVAADVLAAQAAGGQEAVLTGVHLGSWGHDLDRPRHLSHLIQYILKETAIPRLRISSLEPWDLDADFFDLWQDPRLCRHLHLPLQSGSASVLRRMARKTTPQDYAALVAAARTSIPDVAVTTDLIVGFPGESEEEFQQSCDFVEAMQFAGGHVFTYSARPGTAAARMPDQVHNFTRKERNAALRRITDRSAQAYRERFIGQQLDVLWESANPVPATGQWLLSGLTGNYLRVQASVSEPLTNQVTPTQLLALSENKSFLLGKICQ